jgi:hypothetical protein
MKDILILLLVIVGSFALVAWLSVLFQRRFNLQRRGLLPRVTKKIAGNSHIHGLCVCGCLLGRIVLPGAIPQYFPAYRSYCACV